MARKPAKRKAAAPGKPKTNRKPAAEKGEIAVKIDAETEHFFNLITTRKFERIEYKGEKGIQLAQEWIKENIKTIQQVIVYKNGYGVFFDTDVKEFESVYDSMATSFTIEIIRKKDEK